MAQQPEKKESTQKITGRLTRRFSKTGELRIRLEEKKRQQLVLPGERPSFLWILLLISGVLLILGALFAFFLHMDAVRSKEEIIGLCGLIGAIGVGCLGFYFKRWGKM